MKVRNFSTAKGNIIKMKRDSTVWENIFANDILDKGLISKIYKELIWLNTRKTYKPIKKWAKDLNRHFPKEDTLMAHRHMKRCSTFCFKRSKLKPTTLRYHLTPVRIAIINKSTNMCQQGCGEKRILIHCWCECRLVQTLWKTVWNFLRKLKMELPFDPAIPLLGSYIKNPRTLVQKNLCTPMFIAAQCTISQVLEAT